MRVPFIASLIIPTTIVKNTQSFVLPSIGAKRSRSDTTTQRHGINEWRDTDFDISGDSYSQPMGSEDGLPRKVCVLPFPFSDILLQGETKQLRLYEDRFLKLFDKCMDEHNGVLAMGLIASSGIIQTAPLCEVEAYNRMGDGFGIFVTIRVVGRCRLVEVTDQEPFIEAVCQDVRDGPVEERLEGLDMVAGNIENFVVTIASLERRLEESAELELRGEEDGETKGQKLSIEDIEDGEMRNWLLDDVDDDDDDDDDDYSSIEDNLEYEDSNAKFKNAFHQARNTDSQGYTISQSTSEETCDEYTKDEPCRNVQDLTALSWAAFCTDDVHCKYRIQALDTTVLFDRLKLGSYMLRERKAELEAKLALLDIQAPSDDDILQ
eukprot:CAMPEP_0172491350 /NCGR_PEP_ID=MMETSP1066-20121228/22114_1 /TAXON_ID=671091 /ORGANISM="Coscinodiscus wailesii, Strain CCMP2513" /LENGTH=377 /DNA_ID=CAMNT_0013260353 /DNA_START=8 /DNA_END=1141 /DNA_ORIENTATION=+